MNPALESVLNAAWDQHAVTREKRTQVKKQRDEFLALAMANAVAGTATSEQIRVWLVQAQTLENVLSTVLAETKKD